MPTPHPFQQRLTLLICSVILLATTHANAGLFWPFRRAQKPSPPPPPPAYIPPPQYYHQPYAYHPAHYPAAQAQPVAWQQPYYPPMPPQPQHYGGHGFGERPALPALQPPPIRQEQPRYQPVVYRPQPPPAPISRPSGSLASMMTVECQRLARMGLRYQFGSMDPYNGGLDCSGSVKCVLERCGVRGVPRTASDQYVWLENAGSLTPLRRGANGDWILNRVRPGDLLFWRGTYVTNRVPDVSHVMIYLGRDRTTGKPMMFGARSNTSRTGVNGHAVDVFEFNPVPNGRSEFIGFGSVPRQARPSGFTAVANQQY